MTDTTEFRNLILIKETEKAFHVHQQDRRGDNFQWIPKSVCIHIHRYLKEEPPKVSLTIEDWFIEKDGFALSI